MSQTKDTQDDDAVGIVYDPPSGQEGPPHLAVIFFQGQAIACEPVDSIEDGEALLEAMMQKLPDMLRQVREESGEADLIAAAEGKTH